MVTRRSIDILCPVD
jgi:hypothetical protein